MPKEQANPALDKCAVILLMITDQYPQLVAVVIKEWMTGE